MRKGRQFTPLNQAAQARRNVESAELHKSMGKINTGAHQNPGTRRARTRSASKTQAIKDSNNGQ